MGSQTVIIFGNVGNDPELKYLQGGEAVCNFSVAVNRGKDQPPTWFRVAAWRQLAEICHAYVTKGMSVQVTGHIRARAYINQYGQPVASLDLTARDVQFGPRGENGQVGDGKLPQPTADNIDDIPF